MAPPRGYKPLPGSERPPADESVRGNRIKESERVNVTILLHSRPGSPAHPDLEHWQDNAGGSRRFLTAEELMDTYGAEEEGLRRVAEFLESNGLRVIEQSAGQRRVVAEGDARAVESAFSVTLYEYTRPDPVETARRRNHDDGPVLEVYRGFDGPVYLPSALLDVVRRDGYALDDQEYLMGLRCVAAVVYNDQAEALAAISVSGLASRVPSERLPQLGKLVRDTARELTLALGGRLP